ncbi:rod shape-determining protein RodA [Candidatus Endobugula sertula]|uniref:Peptidoglycan glycosyltransferase MrdB n=1 Tax=Candidatus Endobugula sertula TaxID=62101 RepID=A0A1D2QQA7_9GAMM|nr:rod shape-determining protein RodA [Candidatus Endobugula sertula]
MSSVRHYDFLRRMPEASHDLRQRLSFWQVIHIDPILLLLLFALTVCGLWVLYSASEGNIRMMQRQGVFFVIAYIGLFAVAQVRLSLVARWSIFLYLGGVALLIAVLFIGVGAKGAQRWLSLGSFRFQPSEIMKLAMPIVISAYLSSKALPPRFKHIFWLLILVFVPTSLIMLQPDLGTSILVAASGLIVLFYAGLSWRYILAAFTLIVMSIWPMWQYVLRDYQRQRVITLFDPESDPQGAGWNIIQSKTAIGSGGITGKGWLEGTQSHLNFLPESHTDFIIAVLAEEFGFIGVVVLLALYLLIIFRGLVIAVNGQDSFRRLLAGSITLTFFIYVFVNVGMVAGLLPVVGVPLPLVSLGGTSLVTLMLGFGVLMAISTEQRRVVNK